MTCRQVDGDSEWLQGYNRLSMRTSGARNQSWSATVFQERPACRLPVSTAVMQRQSSEVHQTSCKRPSLAWGSGWAVPTAGMRHSHIHQPHASCTHQCGVAVEQCPNRQGLGTRHQLPSWHTVHDALGTQRGDECKLIRSHGGTHALACSMDGSRYLRRSTAQPSYDQGSADN